MDLKIIGLAITALLGFTSLLFGPKIADHLGYGKSLTPLGNIEFRVTYGAFFIALGALAIRLNNPDVHLLIGVCWLSAGVTRSVLFALTRKDIKENIFGLIIELGIAALLLFN
jgi:hypothetical protein